jgi:hypothetical protein
MRSATDLEARRYCSQEEGTRRIAEDGSVYFESPEEHCFFIKSPSEYRRLAYLCQHLIGSIRGGNYAGGLVWLRMWDVGAEYLRPLGWKIIENQRRANGDTRSLDLAPAQFFGEDESLDLQVFLMTVLGNGWSGCFVPDGANFVVEFRSSHRLFFYCESEAALNRLKLELEVFEPQPDAGAESK